MGSQDEIDPALIREISQLGQEYTNPVRLNALEAEFRGVGGLFVYSMALGDFLEVAIDGKTPDGLQVEEDGILIGRLTDNMAGKLHIVGDTRQTEKWLDQSINLGTSINSGGMFTRGGLLRGYIIPNGCVTADLSGMHFGGDEEDIRVLPARYSGIKVNGHTLFDSIGHR